MPADQTSENPFPTVSPLRSLWDTLVARPDVPPLLPKRPYDPGVTQALRALSGVDRPSDNVLAALYLLNDDLESAHVLVQDGADATACYLHMIVHRREGDWSNTKYWVARTGSHPFYESAAALTGESRWDATGMVDRCREASRGGEGADAVARLSAAETAGLAAWCVTHGA